MSDSARSALDRLQVRFVTFHETAADERARIADRLRVVQADESILIETCHRVELVTVGGEPVANGGVLGRDAARRVMEVVAGFDSAVVAEEQLLGQVRAAYDKALAGGTSGPILNELMRRALRFGRRVRSHAQPGADRSLAGPAADWIVERVPPAARIVVAGTGEIARLVAGRLAHAGHPVSVVSRAIDRGRRVVDDLPRGDHRVVVGTVTSEVLRGTAGMVLAVRGGTPVLTADAVASDAPPWVLDLSSPSAIEPAARARLGERLLDVDGLGTRHAPRPVLVPRAEARLRRELEAEVDAFVAWLGTRRGADALSVLQREVDIVRHRHLERLRRHAALSPEQVAAVDASSAAMVRELLHGPIRELRHGGADAATVRRLFRIGA